MRTEKDSIYGGNMKRKLFNAASGTAILIALAAFGFTIGSCAGTPAPKLEAGKQYTLTVLHTNDHHGTVLTNGGQAGLAERATFVKGARQANDNVLLLDAGDINTGSALSNICLLYTSPSPRDSREGRMPWCGLVD